MSKWLVVLNALKTVYRVGGKPALAGALLLVVGLTLVPNASKLCESLSSNLPQLLP
jgi:hypothetical protein